MTKPAARAWVKSQWTGFDWPGLSVKAQGVLPQAIKMASNQLNTLSVELNLLAYNAISGELDLTAALPGLDLNPNHLWLPKVMGQHLWAGQWSADRLIPGSYGIPEPVDALSDNWHNRKPLLLLVPCLAVSPAGYRLGRGKGYYDRLLARLGDEGWFAVGVCPAALTQRNDWDPDAWDAPLHAVMTENGLIQFNANAIR